MGYITGRRLFAISGPQIVSRPLNFSASLVKPYSEADTYKIYFLLLSSIRHYFPKQNTTGRVPVVKDGFALWAVSLNQPWLTSRKHGVWLSWDSHPRRVLRWLHPLRCLWLCRSIIVGCSGHGGAIHHGLLFGRTFLARHL